MRCAIGIDVGGTKCAAGLVALDDGRVIERALRPTRPERGGEEVLADVVEMARGLQEVAKGIGERPESIGIGLCELVGQDGRILSEATIRWMGMQIVERVREETKLQVAMNADVRAAARAEAYFGAGRELGCFLYVTVGTGISCCLVVDKRPYAGARGLTGTFASGNGLIAGSNGQLFGGVALEQFASGPAIAARLAAIRPGFSGAAPDVLTLAESDDPLASEIVSTAGRALGAAIAQLVNVLDPEAVVIGGGLGLAAGLYRRSVEVGLREYVWSDLHRDVPLVSAELGNDAGVIGAALVDDTPFCSALAKVDVVDPRLA